MAKSNENASTVKNSSHTSTSAHETGIPQQIIYPELVEITLQIKRINDYFLAYREKTDKREECIHSILSDIENGLVGVVVCIGDIAKDEFINNVFNKD
ncbi:hypothetical protein EZS27_031717 [termite gut metagenome]|uniref:Uncharacterized protein n=1 Tax=termite gut metagenome TaxID=433724 RepID=A0A5J4QBC6_9ZZZZ